MVFLDFPLWREKSSDPKLHISSIHRKTKCRENSLCREMTLSKESFQSTSFQKGHYRPPRGQGCLSFNACRSSPAQGQCEAQLEVSRCPRKLFHCEIFLVDKRENQTHHKVKVCLGQASAFKEAYVGRWMKNREEELEKGLRRSEGRNTDQKPRGGSSVESRERSR